MVRDTSREANNHMEASGEKERHQAMIMDALTKNGAGTGAQIAEWTGLRYDQVMRRTSDLEGKQLICASTEKGKSPTGRKATIWMLVNQ